jgi:hypothetical protein
MINGYATLLGARLSGVLNQWAARSAAARLSRACVIALGVAIGAIGVFGGGEAKASYTGTNHGWNELRPTVNWLCVDVASAYTHNGARIIQWPCHGGANQQWRAEYWGICGGEQLGASVYSCYRFRSLHSGKCLDIPSLTNASNTHLWDCHWNENQVFVARDLLASDPYNNVYTDHRFYFVSKMSRHQQNFTRCLDVPYGVGDWGVPINSHACNYSDAQKFYFWGIGRY